MGAVWVLSASEEVPLLAGKVGVGGGRDIAVSVDGFALMTTDAASCELALAKATGL